MFTAMVENYPGFAEGVLGPKLMKNMQQQAKRFGAEILFENVTEVDFSTDPFMVLSGGRTLMGRSVIIATGSSPKWLGLDSEARLRGRGVATCATCDAPMYIDKKTVVVGGGDEALEEALALAEFAEKVTVLHRREGLRATKILQERAFQNDKISFIWNTVIQEVLGVEKVEGLRLHNVKTGEESELVVDGVFIAVGYKPNTDIFEGKLALDANGFVIVHDETKTSVEGVFVAGDAKDPRYRQVVTAAGDGCKAALDSERYLRNYQS
jgi:thioredoxin reductase (NADPH)